MKLRGQRGHPMEGIPTPATSVRNVQKTSCRRRGGYGGQGKAPSQVPEVRRSAFITELLGPFGNSIHFFLVLFFQRLKFFKAVWDVHFQTDLQIWVYFLEWNSGPYACAPRNEGRLLTLKRQETQNITQERQMQPGMGEIHTSEKGGVRRRHVNDLKSVGSFIF